MSRSVPPHNASPFQPGTLEINRPNLPPVAGIKSNPDAVAAAEAFLKDSPPCLIDAPTALLASASRDGGSGVVTVKVSWTAGVGPTSGHSLDVSSMGATLPSGALAQVCARVLPSLPSHPCPLVPRLRLSFVLLLCCCVGVVCSDPVV